MLTRKRVRKSPAATPGYYHLQAWNILLAGPQNWNVAEARKEGAPSDAIYRRGPGDYARASEIAALDTRKAVEKKAAKLEREAR